MSTINDLNTTNTLEDDDKLIVWKRQSGATRAITATNAAQYFSDEISGNFQPFNAFLASIASQSPNTQPGRYFEITGLDTVDLITGANLLANIGGLAADPTLLMYVALGMTDGKIVRGTGVDTAELIDQEDIEVIASGSVTPRTLADRFGERRSILDFIPFALHADILAGNSNEDLTDYIQDWIEVLAAEGGEGYVPPGKYLIDERGPNAGGVVVRNIERSWQVTCANGATFVAGQDLDATMLRFQTGQAQFNVGEEPSIIWRGGLFDFSAQKNDSTAPYPGIGTINPGTANVIGCIDVRGEQSTAGAVPGFDLVEISGVRLVGAPVGGGWETAGGGTGIFAAGFKQGRFYDCAARRVRGSPLYISHGNLPTVTADSIVATGWDVRDSAFGLAIRRDATRLILAHNTIQNVVIGVLAVPISPAQGPHVVHIHDNVIQNYWKGLLFDAASHVYAHDNTIKDYGILDGSGNPTTFSTFVNGVAIEGRGLTESSLRQNRIFGRLAHTSGEVVDGLRLGQSTVPVTAQSLHNLVAENEIADVDRALVEANSTDFTTFYKNRVSVSVSDPLPVMVGPNSTYEPTGPLSERKSILNLIPFALHADILAGNSNEDLAEYFQTMLETGGDWYIPDGQYTIGPAGADTDAVLASLTRSVHVVCGPNVVIAAGADLDGDMIRAQVPSNGAGLDGQIDFIWEGGYFDQSGQKVSTSVPFISEYPPSNQGTSATADALRIEGAYNPGSGLRNGIRLAHVTRATFYCGDHWQNAGGDQSVTSGYGADLSIVDQCTFIGNRDLGVYMTPENTSTAKGFCIIESNLFVNCFGGAAVKRSINGFSISGNEFINCVVGAAAYWIVGNRSSDGMINENVYRQCQVNVRLDYCERVTVRDNKSYQYGAVLANGTTKVTAYGLFLIDLKGCRYCHVEGNQSAGLSSAYTGDSVGHILLEQFDTGSGTVNSEYNTVLNNISAGLTFPGRENVSEADYNRIEGNVEITGAAANFQRNGANSGEERYSFATGIKTIMRPLYFDNGSESAPAIARRGQTSVGIGFGANEVFSTISGSKRHRVLASGVESIQSHIVRDLAGKGGLFTGFTNNVVTLGSGSSVTVSGARPAGCVIEGVTVRITTSLSGAGGVTGIQVGDGSDADRYGVISGTTQGLTCGGTTNPPTANPRSYSASAEDIVITAVGGTFAGGAVRVSVAYSVMLPAEL